jgi:hypothetical protein
VLLADGLVVAEGTHDELLATSERYRTVLAAADASGPAAVGGAEAGVGTKYGSRSDPASGVRS